MASIPVDLFNPGQVFACLGFLEAADVLLGQAEGGFDWRNEGDVHFEVRAAGDKNPFDVVLAFLAEAEIRRCVPKGCADPAEKKKKKRRRDAEREKGVDSLASDAPELCETFPGPKGDAMALPIRLVGSVDGQIRSLSVSHWADASSRNDFKLYAGNRSAADIAWAMLRGTREKPKKGAEEGEMKTRGVYALWKSSRKDLISKPFDVLTPMRGSFNFDPRGAWTAIDAGYSPNDQKHAVSASPVVEILAAVGCEYARPREYKRRRVRYAAWSGLVPPILARAAFGGARIGIPVRTFRFALDLSGKNKVVTFAEEEMSA